MFRTRICGPLAALFVISFLSFGLSSTPVRAQCLSGEGYGFIQVKTTFTGWISVADSNCNPDESMAIYSFSLSLVDFTAGRTATIASGAGDPNVHTSNPLTTLTPQNMSGGPGWEGPYVFSTNSLRDIGTYDYLFEGVSTDGTNLYPMTSDLLGFYVDNDPPSVNLSFGGPYNVGDTATLNANASDPDGGSLTYSWTILSKPSGSPGNLSSGSSASPTISLGNKNDIGDWQIRLRVHDDEAEQITETSTFEVENRDPVVTISGPTQIDALTDIVLTANPQTDQDGETVTFSWDLQSAPTNSSYGPMSGFETARVLTRTTGPEDIGIFEFDVTGTDEHGGDDTASHTIEVLAIPPEIDLVGETTIDTGEAIDLETLIVDDAYGDPLTSFEWELRQVPNESGEPLGVRGSSASLFIPTGDSDAGTWRFRLTVTDQVGETAEEDITVLVDGLPDADVVGPDQTSSLTLDLTLDGSGSFDPDTPGSAPDYNHQAVDSVQGISPGITTYIWSVLDVPPEHYGEYYPSTVADLFGVNGSGPTLYFGPGVLPSGLWLFELEVVDGEGNSDYATHSVDVIEEGLPPFALLSSPSFHVLTAEGLATAPIGVSGAASFDLDNLLDEPLAPGLGIEDYAWSWFTVPPTCFSPPVLPSGPSATLALMYGAGVQVPGGCQGIYQPTLTVTDDDEPMARSSTATGLVMIGNCAGALCINHPTNAAPEYVKFSDQTNTLIYYRLNSILYDAPAYAAGLRLRLEITPSLTVAPPIYDRAWDLDLLPFEKGGPLAVHWSGFTNGNDRPEPGLYDVTLQLVDSTGTPTGDVAVELSAIHIQTLDVAVDPGAEALLNLNGAEEATDDLEIPYTVTGAMPGETGFDEIVLRVFELGTSALVYQQAFGGLLSTADTLVWNGEIGSGIFIDPGAYEYELEIFETGASLGISDRHEFDAYRIDAELTGIADTDEFDPGAVLTVTDTLDLTITFEGDLTRLTGDVGLEVVAENGTLSATDGTVTFDIDTGVDFPVSGFATPQVFTLEGTTPGTAGKTELDVTFTPATGTNSSQTATDPVAITVAEVKLRVAASDPARQDTDGVFLRGARAPVAVTAANLAELRHLMQPLTVTVAPEYPGATVELSLTSGTGANIGIYEDGGGATPLILPKTWTTGDFASGKLEVDLLAYGGAFGEAKLRLAYKDGATVLASEDILFRIGHQPGVVGQTIAPPQYPFFRPVPVQNATTPVTVAIDPARHSEWHGRSVAIYVVAHKTPAQWAADPALADVTGGPNTVSVTAGSIAANTHSVWASATGGNYDIVIDMGNAPETPGTFAPDGTLDPGDMLIHEVGGLPSLSVYAPFTAMGGDATVTNDYGMVAPITRTMIDAGYNGLSVPPPGFDFRLRGRVVRPDPVLVGSPIVVIAHGNHTPFTTPVSAVSPLITSDENFRGYQWLQEYLASHGFVTISIDLDETTGGLGFPTTPGTFGIQLRGWLMLKNLEMALTDGTFEGGALTGNIDMSRIYFLGHSRGGEAALQAVHLLNNAGDRPASGTLNVVMLGITPAGVVSLAPTSKSLDLGNLDAHNVPHLLLYGTADGDVHGAVGVAAPYRHYDRGLAERFAITIEGANHNNWNTSWGYNDATDDVTGSIAAPTITPLATPVGAAGTLIGAVDQQQIALGYIGAYLRMVDQGDPIARAFLIEPPARLRPGGIGAGPILHSQSRKRPSDLIAVLDDYQTNGSNTLASSGGAVATGGALSGLDEGKLLDTSPGAASQPEDRFYHETNGAVFDWSGAASYTQDLPVTARDLRGTRAISLRVAQQPDHARTNALAADLSFELEIEDGAAATSAISVSTLGLVPDIYPSAVGGTDTTAGIFTTYRFPVHSFETDGRAIDLGDIRKIRLKFADGTHSGEGRLAVDELEIE